MTTPTNPLKSRHQDQLIDAFLDEGPMDLRDQVLDEVRSEVDRTDQRTAFGPWRNHMATRFAGFAAVTAVVAGAIVVGLALGGRGPLIGNAPSDTPEPSAQYQMLPPPDCNELTAGSYRALLGSLSVDVTVPSEWRGGADPGSFWLSSGPCVMGTSQRIEVALVTHVYGDACDRQEAIETGSPAAVTAALAAQTGHETSGPIETTLGGHPANRLELVMPDFDDTTCPGDGGLQLWRAAPGQGVVRGAEAHGTDIVTVYVVDVDGSAVAVAVVNPDAEFESVVDSLRFTSAATADSSVEPSEASASVEPSEAQPSPLAHVPCCTSADTDPADPGLFVIWDDVHGGYHVTVEVPGPGWEGAEPQHALIYNDSFDPPAGAGLIVFQTGDVPADACSWFTVTPADTEETVDGYVAALSRQASRDATEPVDLSVGGYPGKAITLHVPGDAVFSECDQELFTTLTMAVFGNPSPVADRVAQGPGQIDEFWVVDVRGHVVMFDIAYGPETPQEVIDDMRAMVESATFGDTFK